MAFLVQNVMFFPIFLSSISRDSKLMKIRPIEALVPKVGIRDQLCIMNTKENS